MTPLEFLLLVFSLSVGAGMFGALLGLGGGIIIIPVLTLLLKVDIRYAIGASIVSVIATSSGAAATYVKERMANFRVAMFLEVATTAGALTGAYLAGVVSRKWLYIIFSLVMGYTALMMFRNRSMGTAAEAPPDCLADRLRLHGSYQDPFFGQVSYRVTRTRIGLGISYIAGVLSGLLGIGGGPLKVPAMNLAMQLPIKAASATSNFMIGITAATSAGVYFSRGDINPFVAAPVAVGVLLGSTIGSHLLAHLRSSVLRIAFIGVLLWISIQMLLKGLQ